MTGTGRLAGLKAVVTGAAMGLGRSIAETFVREGAEIALIDRNAEGVKQAVAELRGTGGVAHAVTGDLGAVAGVRAAIEAAAAALGGIDILVNNAAIAVRQPFDAETEDGWDRTFAINAKAYYFAIQAALPHLRQSSHKAIVNISSMAGSRGIGGLTAYCSSKGAVDALSRALAVELAPEAIRVNVVSPGSMLTPAMQQSIDRIDAMGGSGREAIANLTNRQLFRRVADPSEVAAICLFLASSDASYLTGEIINASAGWSAN